MITYNKGIELTGGNNEELPVVFKKIAFKQNFETGSDESI